MVKINRNEDYHKQMEGSRGPTGDQYPCVICGRGVNENTAKYIHLHRGGTHAVSEQEAEQLEADGQGGGDLGCYPVGSDCWKKHPELHPYEIKIKE